MSTLCEQYRLVPHVRSKFGGPAEGYCDICRTNVASGRADIAHLIFECRSVDFVATRARWRAEYEGEIAAAGATVVRARRPPRKRNSRKECRSRACPASLELDSRSTPPG